MEMEKFYTKAKIVCSIIRLYHMEGLVYAALMQQQHHHHPTTREQIYIASSVICFQPNL